MHKSFERDLFHIQDLETRFYSSFTKVDWKSDSKYLALFHDLMALVRIVRRVVEKLERPEATDPSVAAGAHSSEGNLEETGAEHFHGGEIGVVSHDAPSNSGSKC
jgi:hypothetical protein